jgi:hypothetical protein
MKMKLMKYRWLFGGMWMRLWVAVTISIALSVGMATEAQSVSTTTVLGTVYLANGQPTSGTVLVSWPAFTTASGSAVTAGSTAVMIGADGFLSVNLAPNAGATPAGLYYTAVYHLSDGTTSTEYWVVPAAAQATIGSVRALLMPATQAVQAVSKAYVDQAISQAQASQITSSGGTLSGPLYLSGDPTQSLQAADKHYVDISVGQAVPLAGGTMTGVLTTPSIGIVNGADAEADATLMAGLTRSQQESLNYKDWNGNGQWAMMKDASNNWALNSSTSGLDSFKAYQSTNSGDTYINTSNSSGAVRVNYESGSGTQFRIYGGNSSTLYAAFTGAQSIQFPGLASGSGHNCLQIDSSGFLTNTGIACGVVNSGAAGQIAYYSSNGTVLAGTNMVPVSAGGTGASTAAGALLSLNAQVAIPGVSTDGANGITVTGAVSAGAINSTPLVWANANKVLTKPSFVGAGSFPTLSNMFSSNVWTSTPPTQNSTWTTGDFLLALHGGVWDQWGWVNNTGGYKSAAYILENHTKGSSNPLYLTTNQYGIGETYGIFNNIICYAGTTAASSEGCEAQDNWVQQGSVDYAGTVDAATTGTGITTVTVDVTAGSGTQGEGRYLINLTDVINAGTISAITIPSGTYTTFTGSGTGWPVSTANTTLGTAISTPGSVTVTPASMTGITTSTVLCIADASNFETVKPSAVTSSTFTATFRKTYTSSAIVAAGGLCGYQMSITSDTNSAGQILTFPVIRSTSATSADVWIAKTSSWSGYPGTWSAATNNAYNAIPSAEVVAVNNGGSTLSDTLTLAPNTVSWNSGDNVQLPMYFALDQQEGNTVLTRSRISVGNQMGRVRNFGSNFVERNYSAAIGQWYINNTPWAAYQQPSTNFPHGLLFSGVWKNAIEMVNAPAWGDGAPVQITGCAVSGCSTTRIIEIPFSSGDDYLAYDMQHGNWTLSTGFNAHYLSVGADGSFDAAYFKISGNAVIPTTVTGYHGTSGTKVQLSDGTGTSGYLPAFASDGSLTNGYAVGTSGGVIPLLNGANTWSAAQTFSSTTTHTGLASFTAGLATTTAGTGTLGSATKWFNSTYLGTGTSYYTQLTPNASQTGNVTLTIPNVSGSDNMMTTATAQTITGAKLHTGSASALTSAASTTSTSFASTGIVLPSVPVSTTAVGHCVVIWEGSSTSYSTTLGFGMNNTPTGLYVTNTAHTGASGATSADLYTTITNTTTTAISAAMTPTATSTGYKDEVDFTLVSGSSNAVTLTLYYKSSSASGTSYVEPGSYCRWY